MEYPPFNQKSKCAKCGTKDAATQHCLGFDPGSRTQCYWGPEDHLHRICTCCGARWAEACLDSVKNIPWRG